MTFFAVYLVLIDIVVFSQRYATFTQTYILYKTLETNVQGN